MTTLSSFRLSWSAVLWAALLPAITLPVAGQEAPAAPRTQAQQLLAPLPEVDLSALEPAVGEQIESMLGEVQKLLANPAAQPAQFSQSFGELGQVLHAYGLTEAAAAAYENASIAAPRDFRWLYYLGVLRQAEGELDQAAELLDRALGFDRNHLAAMVRRGEIEIARDQPDAAIPYLQRALTQNPTSAAALAALGQVALSKRDFRTAVEHLESALAALPEATRLHYPLALAYRGLGEEEKARHHLALRGPVGARPADPLIDQLEEFKRGERVHLIRGGTAFRAGRYTEAAESFRSAVEANPESLSARVNLAAALAALGKPLDAEAELIRAIGLAPENANARYNLGLLLAQRGELEGAIDQLRMAAGHAPEDLLIRLQLARTLAAGRLTSEALLHYQAAIALAPDQPQPRFGEAQMLVRQERYAEAVQRLDDLLDVVPGNLPATEALAHILAAAPDEAVRDGERALSLAKQVYAAGRSPSRARTLAEAYAELGQCDKAAEWQQLAAELAQSAGDEATAASLAQGVETYRAGPPCRPPLPPPPPDSPPAM